MTEFLLQLIAGFITSSAFSILYSVPKKLVPFTGIVGATGYIISFSLLNYLELGNFLSITIASFFIGVLSQLFAQNLKAPIIIFSMPGIIPLVPGGSAYRMMRSFIEGNADLGISFATETLLAAGALALGLALNSAIFQLLTNKNILGRRRPFFHNN